MANGYSVIIDGITSDGTNLYVLVRISSGSTTFPTIQVIFPVGTAASAITAYIQTIATNGPSLTASIGALVGSQVTA